jgi:hypothetical protein
MNMQNHDKTVSNKVRLDILTKQFEEFDNENHNDHQRIFEALDKISNRLTKIETKLTVEREKDKQILTVRMWLISFILSLVTYIISLVIRR